MRSASTENPMTQALALDDAGSIPSLRTLLAQAPTALAKLDVAKSILAAREEAAKPAALVANDVAVPLEPLLVDWTPRFTSSIPPEFRTLPRRNQHLLFSTGVDLGMMQLTATATFEGEKSSGAGRAADDLAKIKACEADGYKRQRVKMAGLNILGFVFVKDGLAVTPEGAAKLAGLEAPAPAVSKARVTKAEAREAYDTLSYLLTSYLQQHDTELLRVDFSERLLPLVESVKELVQRGWPEGVSDPQYLFEKAESTIARQDRLKAEGLTKDMGRGEARDYLRNNGLSPERIEAVVANPTSVRTSGMHEAPQYTMAYLNEAIATAKSQLALIEVAAALPSEAAWEVDYSKMFDPSFIKEMNVLKHLHDSVLAAMYEGNAETMIESDRILSLFVDALTPQQFKRYDHGKAEKVLFDKLNEMERELVLGMQDSQPAPEPVAPGVAEVVPTEDQTYLQSIIDGTIDLLDPGIFGKLEPMFTKYADDAEMMGMLNRAAEAYTAAAVAAAKGV